jgi:hypothetical protein
VPNAKSPSRRKRITVPSTSPAAATQDKSAFDVLSWTDEQRELHRAIAEVHQLAARCRLAEIVRELMPEAHELAARAQNTSAGTPVKSTNASPGTA